MCDDDARQENQRTTPRMREISARLPAAALVDACAETEEVKSSVGTKRQPTGTGRKGVRELNQNENQ